MAGTVSELLFESRVDALVRLSGRLGTLVLPAAAAGIPAGDLAAAVYDLLDIPLGDLVLRAWEKHRLVERACAETRHRPGVVQQVRLARHTLESVHRPRIECEAAGRTVPLLTLELALVFKIDAVVFRIADGEIAAVTPGTATAEASLKAGGVVLVDQHLAEVSLPAWERVPRQLTTRAGFADVR